MLFTLFKKILVSGMLVFVGLSLTQSVQAGVSPKDGKATVVSTLKHRIDLIESKMMVENYALSQGAHEDLRELQLSKTRAQQTLEKLKNVSQANWENLKDEAVLRVGRLEGQYDSFKNRYSQY